MNEYNERILKNVLQDSREDSNAELLKEIEDAKNDEMFSVSAQEAKAFAKQHTAKSKKKSKKMLLKVASVLLIIAISVSFIPFTVEGRKSTLAEIIVNLVNSDFVIFGNNENDNMLLSYEGEFVPTYIPEGYSVESIVNNESHKLLTFTNSRNNYILISENINDLKTNIDHENLDYEENIVILNYNGIYYKKDNNYYIFFLTDTSSVHITCDDNNVDLIGFANKIEKR